MTTSQGMNRRSQVTIGVEYNCLEAQQGLYLHYCWFSQCRIANERLIRPLER